MIPPTKSKKRSHSVDPEVEEVSNKDLLSWIIRRVTLSDSYITKLVDEKVAGMEKKILNQF